MRLAVQISISLLALSWCASGQLTDILGLAPSTAGVCGDSSYRVTICFPGRPQNATCTYSIQSGSTPGINSLESIQGECPMSKLFQQPCLELPGAITIAFGPCTLEDSPPEPAQNNTLDVQGWMDVLGFRDLQVLGALTIRGYVYQEKFPLFGVNLLPSLTNLEDLPSLFNENPLNAQIALIGMSLPQLPKLLKIPSGFSMLNSPDVDFTQPQRFPSLVTIDNGLVIAGCPSLLSLEGLEGLRGDNLLNNIGIINNPILSNISALSGLFNCTSDGKTALNKTTPIGFITTHPLNVQNISHACTLQTAETVCQFIADNSQCPEGTEFVRNNDGTFERVYQTKSGTTPPGIAPVPSFERLSPLPALPSNFGGG